MFTVAIRSCGVAIGNALVSTSLLFAILLEILVLKRRPSARTIAGAALTVAGIACLGFWRSLLPRCPRGVVSVFVVDTPRPCR
jgi:drug/metabolite transporter (DMT)-like permease